MSETITSLSVIELLERRGARPAIITVEGEATREHSGAEIAERARRLALGLRAAGVEPGEPVGLYGANRPEWVIARLAVGAAGALAAPFDDLLPEEEVAPLIAYNRCRRVFTTRDHLERLRGRFGEAEPQWILLDPDPAPDETIEGAVSWQSLMAAEAGPLPAVDPTAPALVVTTSGTTGQPKSFTLSHAKLSANVRAIEAQGQVGEADRALLPLPLDNVYPYVVGFLSVLVSGGTLIFPEALTGLQIVKALKLGRATLMIGVPRLYAAMLGGIEGKVAARGPLARALFGRLIGLSIWLHRRFALRAGRLLFGGLHRQLGPELRMLISGGARLEPDLIWRLEALGWRVLSGYGLSEVSSVFTANVPGHKRIGTEGRPIHGPETLRIARPDAEGVGEIELKGPSVFEGYRDNPEANAAAFTEDGWFRTGDLGKLDPDGLVVITGRAKEMIVLGGGKNVFPEELEAVYRESPYIEEIAVLELKGNLVGLIVPDREAVRASGYTRVEDLFRVALTELGAKLPSFQRLTGFALSREPIPRTRLGKYRRFMLPQLFEQARRAAGRGAVALSDEDRALLQGSPAREIWALLEARYPDKAISLEADPQLDLGIDSLEWVSLTLELESRFGLRLTEAQIAEIRSLRDLIALASTTAPAAADAEGPDDDADWLRPPGPGLRLLGGALHGLNALLIRLLFRLRVEGREQVPAAAPCLFVANHLSDLDPAVLGAAIPPHQRAALHWGGDRVRLFGARWLHPFWRALRVFPVDERTPAASLASAASVLARGDSLAWFPESWRSPDGSLQAFLPGVGHLIADYAGPIVPVLIQGTFEAMPRDRRLPKPTPVSVRFGAPLDAGELALRCAGDTREKAIAEALREAVAALGRAAPDGTPSRAPKE